MRNRGNFYICDIRDDKYNNVYDLQSESEFGCKGCIVVNKYEWESKFSFAYGLGSKTNKEFVNTFPYEAKGVRDGFRAVAGTILGSVLFAWPVGTIVSLLVTPAVMAAINAFTWTFMVKIYQETWYRLPSRGSTAKQFETNKPYVIHLINSLTY